MKSNATSRFKKSLIEWGCIATLFAVLYFTGLHTQVMGTVQRAMLWTGLFDAEITNTQTVNGPHLSQDDYEFTMVSQNGRFVKLGAFKGDVLFINLWASWCAPCIAEMPNIEELYSGLAEHENIHFIMLSMNSDRSKANKFINRNDFSFIHLFPTTRLPKILKSPSLPTTYVISKKGEIVFKHKGIGNYSAPEFRNWLIKLAAE